MATWSATTYCKGIRSRKRIAESPPSPLMTACPTSKNEEHPRETLQVLHHLRLGRQGIRRQPENQRSTLSMPWCHRRSMSLSMSPHRRQFAPGQSAPGRSTPSRTQRTKYMRVRTWGRRWRACHASEGKDVYFADARETTEEAARDADLLLLASALWRQRRGHASLAGQGTQV